MPYWQHGARAGSRRRGGCRAAVATPRARVVGAVVFGRAPRSGARPTWRSARVVVTDSSAASCVFATTFDAMCASIAPSSSWAFAAKALGTCASLDV